jgi:uncharacterized protein (DUF2336 family)
MTTPHALTKSDVERLLNGPTPEARIETMSKLVRDIEAGELDDEERALAIDVLKCFAQDAEVAVREAVAWQVHNSPLLSDDLAVQLSQDIDRVAFPILRHAQGLSDQFLLRVVAEDNPNKHMAIASRTRVTAVVAHALVEGGNVTVISCLMHNPGAELAEPTLTKAIDRFGGYRHISNAIALRPDLSVAMVERLIAFVSTNIRSTLVKAHDLAPELVDRLVSNARDAATMQLLRPLLKNSDDARRTALWLHSNGRVSMSLLFRALCAGDIQLFTASLAARADVAVETARTLAWDDGPLGLRALFRRAMFPSTIEAPFRVAIRVAKEMMFEGGDQRRDTFQSEVIARVFEECTPTEEWIVDDLLLQLFDQKSEEVIIRAMDHAGLPFVPAR